MKRVLFIVFGFLGIIINQAPAQETVYDVEYVRVCLIDSIAPDTLVQFWRFSQANNPGGNVVDVTYDLSGAYTPAGTLLPCCSCLTAASDTAGVSPPGSPWWGNGLLFTLFFWGIICAFAIRLIFQLPKPSRIAYFLPLALLFSYSSLSAQSETRYDIEYTCICLVDSIGPGNVVQFYRFTQANNPGGNVVDVTYDLSGAYTPAGTLLSCNDYYLGDNVNTGGGTAGTLAIWTGTYSLGNSSVTESGGNVVGTSFTGAFGLATGTTAQAPVGANGRIRYNTTENGISAWNGAAAAWQYLPWADADNWTAGYLPYTNSTGSALTASGDIRYIGNEFFLRQASDQGAYTFQMQGYMHIVPYSGASSRIIGGAGNSSTATLTVRANDNSGTALQIETGSINMSGTNPRYNQGTYSSSTTFGMNVDNDGTGLACSFDETLIEKSALDSVNRPALYLGAFDANNGTLSGRIKLLSMVPGTYGANNVQSNHFYTAGLFQSWQHKRGTLASSIQDVAYWGTYTAVSDSATYSVKLVPETMVGGTIQKAAAFYGGKVYIGNSTTPAYTLDVNTGGVRIASQSAAPTIAANVLYVDSDDSDLVFSPDGTNWRYIPLSVTQTLENHGSISTSTDGSGDIVVAHGMGVTPTSVQVTVTGTTPYIVTVHTIDATNFTVRFFDMTGAAVTSTAVTATWHAKT